MTQILLKTTKYLLIFTVIANKNNIIIHQNRLFIFSK